MKMRRRLLWQSARWFHIINDGLCLRGGFFAKDEIVESQEKRAAIPAEKQNELRRVTDALLADTGIDAANRQTMSIPIASLSALGAAVSSVIPALRTVTTTTTVNAQGLYTIANMGVGDALKIANNGNFWGAFKTTDGASKFAQLQQAGPINATTVTTLPINPAMIMMAAALHSIEKKLDEIMDMQRQILEFLVCEKESEIEADVQMLSGIVSKYKLNWDNEHYVASNHKMVLDIQRTALKNMRVYQKQVSAALKKKQLLVAHNNVESTFADLQKKFKYYRMALYTYSLASLMEIMLGGNFNEEYIDTVKSEIEQFAGDYRNYFENASAHLEQMAGGAIEANVLKGLGTAGQAVGKFIGSIPKIGKNPVNDLFQKGGAQLTDMASTLEEKTVREFATLGNPGTSILTERMQDMVRIYNHTDRICFDRERIYLVGQ